MNATGTGDDAVTCGICGHETSVAMIVEHLVREHDFDRDERVPFALECKLGYGRFQLRDAWIEQARKNAKASGKPWAPSSSSKTRRDKRIRTMVWALMEVPKRSQR